MRLGMLMAGLIIGVVVVAVARAPEAPAERMIWADGWDRLGSCVETASLDGRTALELHPDGIAMRTGAKYLAGAWAFEPNTGLYRVTFAGRTVSYARINIEGMGCLLVDGGQSKADLGVSWFGKAATLTGD